MLLSNRQYTGQLPTPKNYQAQNINSVAKNTTSTQISVSNRRNQRSLHKRLILNRRQEIYTVSLVHLLVLESRKCSNKIIIDMGMPKGHRNHLKELPMGKVGTI